MNTAGLMSILIGALIGMMGLPACLAPDKALLFYRNLYRSTLAARTLTVIDMLWVGALLLDMPWGGLESYKQLTYALIPVAIVLICLYVDDLLMPRALGGFFLLAPAPILAVFRWEVSLVRYVIIVFCYLLVIAGFALIMNPFVYRKSLEWLGKTTPHFRGTGAIVTALGLLLIGAGLWVF
jgi:hypothetical protein